MYRACKAWRLGDTFLTKAVDFFTLGPSWAGGWQAEAAPLRQAAGKLPGAAGKLPGTSGKLPGAPAKLPGASGKLPGDPGRLPGASESSHA